MTATNHVMTGVLIAITVRHPFLAIPLAFISHYIMDLLPQYGLGDIPEAERDRHKKFKIFVGADSAVALGLFFSVPFLLNSHVPAVLTAWCMVIAQLPDAAWFYRHMIKLHRGRYAPKHWSTRFHKYIQWCERTWGIYFEAVWLAAVVMIISMRAQ